MKGFDFVFHRLFLPSAVVCFHAAGVRSILTSRFTSSTVSAPRGFCEHLILRVSTVLMVAYND